MRAWRSVYGEPAVIDAFSGDPRIVMGGGGADLDYQGGQPTMDQGYENAAIIALFTAPGWCGNFLLPAQRQIGSNFEAIASGAITVQRLTDIQRAAVSALADPAFADVSVVVTNPTGSHTYVTATLGPGKQLTLAQRSGLWSNQALTPASARLVEKST